MIGGSSFPGGPLRIAPGSGSKAPTPDEIAIVVDPAQCNPPTALYEHTRFRLTAAFRIERSALRGKLCQLDTGKMEELRVLRRHGL